MAEPRSTPRNTTACTYLGGNLSITRQATTTHSSRSVSTDSVFRNPAPFGKPNVLPAPSRPEWVPGSTGDLARGKRGHCGAAVSGPLQGQRRAVTNGARLSCVGCCHLVAWPAASLGPLRLSAGTTTTQLTANLQPGTGAWQRLLFRFSSSLHTRLALFLSSALLSGQFRSHAGANQQPSRIRLSN